MTREGLFDLIKDTEYNEAGLKVNWKVHVDDSEKRIYLLFEESNGKLDWFNNFRFAAKLYKNQESCMRVNAGFGAAYKSAKDAIMEDFLKNIEAHPGYSPFISGWSHGAALSVLAAEDFNYRTRSIKSDPDSGKKARVITFGGPKTLFNKKTKAYVTRCCGSVEQYGQFNDCVKDMPPFPGYRHVNLIRVGEKYNFFKWFKPKKYHTEYDVISYEGIPTIV